MTLNRMIGQAKSGSRPAEFVVPGNRVRQVAEHAHAIMHFPGEIDEVEQMIRAGEATLMGIPLRVAG